MSNPLLAVAILAGLGSAAWAEPPRVATDIAPVNGLVARILEGVAEPHVLIPPGASPHDHALRPSDAAALQSADLVVWVGASLTPQLQGPIAALAGSARVLELLDEAGTELLARRETATIAPSLHAEAEPADHPHEHGSSDPHAFLDPDNARLWLESIAAALAEVDPANAATYAANATRGKAEIDAAQTEVAARLAPLAGLRYVVFHDGYQYFEHRFGLHPVATIAAENAAAPSPARLSSVRAAILSQGATCVLTEPQYNPGLIDAVFEGVEVRVAEIDSMGTTLTPGPGFYPALLRDMARSVTECGEPAM